MTAPTATPTRHVVELEVNRYNDGLTSELYLTCPDTPWPYFGMGAKLDGSEPYIFGRALCIDNRGGSKADAERAGTLVVRHGDVMEIRGREYRVEPTHNNNLKLVPVVDDAAVLAEVASMVARARQNAGALHDSNLGRNEVERVALKVATVLGFMEPAGGYHSLTRLGEVAADALNLPAAHRTAVAGLLARVTA